MTFRTPTRWALALAIPVAGAALSFAPALAAPLPLPPCQGIVIVGCQPQGNPPPPQLPGPSPNPSPNPSPAPSPGVGPPPVPGTVQVPTDVGWGTLQNKIFGSGGWLAPQIYQTIIQKQQSYDWFLPVYHRMQDIGALLLIMFFVFGIITAIVNRDPMLLLAVPAGYLPISIGVTVLGIVLTQALEAMTDAFTNYMLMGIGDHAQAGFTNLGALLAAGAAGTALTGSMGAAALLAGGILLLGMFGLLLELLMRQLAIYGALLFIPLTAAAMVWPFLRRLIIVHAELLIGVILLKFIVAALLVMGFAALAANPFSMGPAGDPGFVSILMGVAVVGAALVLGPAALLKMVPFMHAQAVSQWSGKARGWAAGKLSPQGMKNFHQSMMQKVGGAAAAKAIPVAGAAAAAVGAAGAVGARGGSFTFPTGSRVLVLPPKVNRTGVGQTGSGARAPVAQRRGQTGGAPLGRPGSTPGGNVVPGGKPPSSPPPTSAASTTPNSPPPTPNTRAPRMQPPNTPMPPGNLPGPPPRKGP